MLELQNFKHFINIENLRSDDSIPYLYLNDSILIDKFLYCPQITIDRSYSAITRYSLTKKFLSKNRSDLKDKFKSNLNSTISIRNTKNNLKGEIILNDNKVFLKINDVILIALCVRAESLYNHISSKTYNSTPYNTFDKNLFYIHINRDLLKNNGLNNVLKPFGFSDKTLYNILIKQWIPVIENNDIPYKIEPPIKFDRFSTVLHDKNCFENIVSNNTSSQNISESLKRYLYFDKDINYYKSNDISLTDNISRIQLYHNEEYC